MRTSNEEQQGNGNASWRASGLPKDNSSKPTSPQDKPLTRDEISGLERIRRELKKWLQAAWNQELPLQSETSFFILVNVLDFFMTYLLITFGAIETNPIADYFFRTWGFRGMLGYKLVTVALVCILAQYVALRSLAKARFVMLLGIVLVGAVVIYSAWLLYGVL